MRRRSKSMLRETQRFERILEFKIDPAHGKERRPDQSTKGDDSEEKGSKWKDLTGSGLEALIS